MNRTTKDSLLRTFLRFIPILPAPELYDLLLSVKRSQTDFDKQVNEAVDSLRNTSALVDTLQKGVEERMAKLQRLREECETYSELSQIEGTKAAALLKAVEVALGKEQAKERWIAFAMHLGFGLIFLLIGVVASDWIKYWITHGWAILTH
jgi:hypothetical protein